jgi:flavin reductase
VSVVEAPAADWDAARQALRRVTSGITILTVNHEGRRHGATVSALVTVSRDPLILGACLRPSSTFASLVRAAGVFSVNVLATHQASLARRFAKPGRPLGDAQFAGLAWSTDGLTGAPLLPECLAYMGCRALDWHQVGDHDLLLAEVVGGRPGRGVPLLSFAGQVSFPNDVSEVP